MSRHSRHSFNLCVGADTKERFPSGRHRRKLKGRTHQTEAGHDTEKRNAKWLSVLLVIPYYKKKFYDRSADITHLIPPSLDVKGNLDGNEVISWCEEGLL